MDLEAVKINILHLSVLFSSPIRNGGSTIDYMCYIHAYNFQNILDLSEQKNILDLVHNIRFPYCPSCWRLLDSKNRKGLSQKNKTCVRALLSLQPSKVFFLANNPPKKFLYKRSYVYVTINMYCKWTLQMSDGTYSIV